MNRFLQARNELIAPAQSSLDAHRFASLVRERVSPLISDDQLPRGPRSSTMPVRNLQGSREDPLLHWLKTGSGGGDCCKWSRHNHGGSRNARSLSFGRPNAGAVVVSCVSGPKPPIVTDQSTCKPPFSWQGGRLQ